MLQFWGAPLFLPPVKLRFGISHLVGTCECYRPLGSDQIQQQVLAMIFF